MDKTRKTKHMSKGFREILICFDDSDLCYALSFTFLSALSCAIQNGFFVK